MCVTETTPPAEGTRALLSGWGRLPGQRVARSERQLLSVPLLSLRDCALIYSAAAPLSTAQLCAGAEAGQDACAGFGGAPLVVLVDGRYTQVPN